MLEELAHQLTARRATFLYRERRLLNSAQSTHIVADGQNLLSFASNDYLGLASHPKLIAALLATLPECALGSGASPLIIGHHRTAQLLETSLAQFLGMPRALSFASGYMANIGVLSALVGRADAIFADQYNHASLNDGALLSRARVHRFRHNDVRALERHLKTSQARRKLVVVDGVFSMDGDLAPLADYLALCEHHDAYLYVDDAHGFGVLGKAGAGSVAHWGLASPRLIIMVTLGKALGVAGALVAAESVIIDTLIQQARTYIYSTAAPPLLAQVALTALHVAQTGDDLRAHLQSLIQGLQNTLPSAWQLLPSSTPIQPLLIGDSARALALSAALQKKGILVPAIRPPSVPKGSARLRISLSAAHKMHDIECLVSALASLEGML